MAHGHRSAVGFIRSVRVEAQRNFRHRAAKASANSEDVDVGGPQAGAGDDLHYRGSGPAVSITGFTAVVAAAPGYDHVA